MKTDKKKMEKWKSLRLAFLFNDKNNLTKTNLP